MTEYPPTSATGEGETTMPDGPDLEEPAEFASAIKPEIRAQIREAQRAADRERLSAKKEAVLAPWASDRASTRQRHWKPRYTLGEDGTITLITAQGTTSSLTVEEAVRGLNTLSRTAEATAAVVEHEHTLRGTVAGLMSSLRAALDGRTTVGSAWEMVDETGRVCRSQQEEPTEAPKPGRAWRLRPEQPVTQWWERIITDSHRRLEEEREAVRRLGWSRP